MAWLYSPPALHRVVAHLPGVVGAVRETGNAVAARARGKLAPHRKTGRTRVTVTHGTVDTFVNLEGKSFTAVLSIEFGHWTTVRRKKSEIASGVPRKRRYVKGLHIITGAAGLV